EVVAAIGLLVQLLFAGVAAAVRPHGCLVS
ncbi:hypothetical protein A2U01_0109329, partial [Trifolium medium]|nr:hypothetical protein [Trifolium medium]